jgi:quercetin dioxygenase-like cupin family protein
MADKSDPFPIARLDLDEEIARMRASPAPAGHLGKTLLRAGDLRVVLIVLGAGAKIPEHSAEGSVAIQVLDGRVVVGALQSSFDLGRGQMLALERGVPHALVAVEDAAILLSIGWRG